MQTDALGGRRSRREKQGSEQQREHGEYREDGPPERSGREDRIQGGLLVRAVETAPVRQADEDAVPQSLWRGAAQAALADDQEELAGVIHSPRAVTAAGDVIAKGGQEILLHLVVEE